MEVSAGSRRHSAGNNPLGVIPGRCRAVTQLAIIVGAHSPQTAIALEEKAVVLSCGNLDYGLRSRCGGI